MTQVKKPLHSKSEVSDEQVRFVRAAREGQRFMSMGPQLAAELSGA